MTPAAQASIAGRVAVVTGAGRGIGREIARALAAAGVHLALVSRTGAEVRAVADELTERHGTQAWPAAMDVTDAAAVDRLVMHVEQRLGGVDLLVHAAGRIEQEAAPLWAVDPEETWDVVTTNLRGPLLLDRALVGQMVRRGHGHVVTVTSLARAARIAGVYTGYAVSKRACSVLTENLAAQLDGTGVVAVDVLPGLVRTAMTDSMSVWRERPPPPSWDDPAWTAAVVLDVARGRYDDRSGQILDAVALERPDPS